MDKVFLWFLLVFATYRLARLISVDYVSLPIREFFGKYAYKNRFNKFFADLIHCPYCVGVWVAFLFALLLAPSNLIIYIVFVLSLAGGQTVLESLTHDE